MPTIESERIAVELEDHAPRVVCYTHKPTGRRIAGVLPGTGALDYLWLLHNHGMSGPRDFSVALRAADAAARYTIHLKRKEGEIVFEMAYRAEGDTLHVEIGRVEERGDLRLRAVDLEQLCMVSNRDESWAVCTSEWERKPFHEFHHGLRRYFDFTAFVRDDLAVAVYSNKPFLPAGIDWYQKYVTRSESIPYHALLFPIYNYRLGDEIQPGFHGMVGLLEDRNGDGAVDWQDICHWRRSFHDLRLHPLYRHSWVSKISCASVPNLTQTTFNQTLALVREMHARCKGTVPAGSWLWILYLSGWQYDGHDTGYPSCNKVCERCGTLEDLHRLIGEARALDINVSVHVNWDDMYAHSPDFTPEIAALGRDGELQRGGLWGGGQAFVVSFYKDYRSGHARRRMREMLDILPLKDTIHFDVLSSAPWTESFEPDGLIGQLQHLVQGKWKVIQMFREEAGLDVTSEFPSHPFLEQLHYLWGIGWDYRGRVQRYLAHGALIYGSNGPGVQCEDALRAAIFRRAAVGVGHSANFDANTEPQDVADLYYLVMLPYRAVAHRRILRIVDDGERVGTVFEDGSRCEGCRQTLSYQVVADGRPIAKDYTVFYPFAPDRYLAYSLEGGTVQYPAPAGWPEGEARCTPVDDRLGKDIAGATVADDIITLNLPAHAGVWVSRQV